MGIAQNIKNLRELRGLKPAHLARDLGVKRTQVSAWENGLYEPREENLNKLTTYFGVSEQELRFGVDAQKLTSVPKLNGMAGLQAELESVKLQLAAEKRVTVSNENVIRLLEKEVRQLNRDLAAALRKKKAK